MKFYDYGMAPSPRKVRMVIIEKGLDIPTEMIDLAQGEHFNDAFRAVNPHCTVPALSLDDGQVLTESEAICRYLEETHPEPPLFGRNALEKAQITERIRQLELDGYLAVAEALRNTAPYFKDRALPGTENYAQIPELGERGRQRTQAFFSKLNQQLENKSHQWLASDDFSMADILAYIIVDFAKRIKLSPAEELTALHQWMALVDQRPSAQA